MNSLCKYLNAGDTHALRWVMGKTVILYHFPIVSRSKVHFFYLNGEKMIFIYDFSWQRTLFVLYTLLPDRDTILLAQIESGAFENAG